MGRWREFIDPFWDHPSLFVQPAGSECGVHVDSLNSDFVQILMSGRKRWIFWPLAEVDQYRSMLAGASFGPRGLDQVEIHLRTYRCQTLAMDQALGANKLSSSATFQICLGCVVLRHPAWKAYK